MPPVTVIRDEHLGRRAKAKAHYDKTASRDLSPLAPGQFVYTRPNEGEAILRAGASSREPRAASLFLRAVKDSCQKIQKRA